MENDILSLEDQFYSPMSHVLIKGVEEAGKWIVYLQASNEMADQDGENIKMDALKKASDYYLSHGVISWDHKHKQTHDPGFIIGEPLDVKFTPDGETLVKGFLYQQNEIAKSLWGNISSGAQKLGASVGGGILKKSKGTISQVIWDETAITHKPVNAGTLGNVQLVPFMEFAKALMAGSGVNAADYTGGRAMTGESLQGDLADIMVNPRDLRELFGGLLLSIRSGRIHDYNDMLNFVYSKGYEGNAAIRLVNYIVQKIPNVVRSAQ